MAYDLLERIANALGIPRGRLGLSHGTEERDSSTPLDDDAERARALAHAAKVVLGRPAFGEPGPMPQIVEDTPPPRRAGKVDVEQIVRLTAEFAELERRSGGGLVLPVLTAQIRRSGALIAAAASVEVKRELLVAVALQHRRASCAAFDLGLLDVARRHVLCALELAHEAQQPALQASLFYCAGRMELYHGPPDSALRLFQFGQPAAVAADLPRLRALLEINEARACAKMSANNLARRAMSSATDLFHGAGQEPPAWLDFFDSAELYGAVGIVWSTLGDDFRAITALRRGLSARPENAVLYRAFDMAELAACHVRNGDVGEGARIGTAVVETVAGLRSRRARTRLNPLLAATRRGGKALRHLHLRIAELQTR